MKSTKNPNRIPLEPATNWSSSSLASHASCCFMGSIKRELYCSTVADKIELKEILSHACCQPRNNYN